MSINDEHDLKGIEKASAVAKHLREFLRERCVAGVTTRELDELCRRELKVLGAESAPRKHYKAPCFAFYSVNNCIVHGLPTDTPLVPGDLVKIDVTPEYEGFVADTACSLVVGGAAGNTLAGRLVDTVERSFELSLEHCRPGVRLSLLGRSIENLTRSRGFFVVEELSGHGVGKAIHEEPSVLNYFDPSQKGVLTEGLVIAIEPMISSRRSELRTKSDGWSLVARSGSLTAHYEHTVLITWDGPVVLTA